MFGITEKIQEAMASHGLFPPGIIIDGHKHRFPTNGRRGDKAGVYCFFDHGNGFVAGYFIDYRTDLFVKWHSKAGQQLDKAERDKVREQLQQARQKAEKERQRAARRAARKAQKMLAEAKPATEDNPYLRSKKVKPCAGLKQLGQTLLIPVMDILGNIHGLQRIKPDSAKLFLTGTAVKGHFFPIQGDKSKLYICEGAATGLSIHEATGNTVYSVFNCGNLLPVAEILHKQYLEHEIVVCADNDQFTEGNPGLTKATETAMAVNAKLAIPEFQNTITKPTDFNDLHQLEGVEEVRRQLENAKMPKADTQTTSKDELFIELAKLDPVEYDKKRRQIADELEVRVSTLDKIIHTIRNEIKGSDKKIYFEAIKPWEDPVDGECLFKEIRSVIKKHIIATDCQVTAIALWILNTYVYDLFQILPILCISSPVPRCGKTTLLSIIQALVAKPIPTSNITGAAIFRLIEKCHPSLLIDEGDTFLTANDELRGILNSGHTKHTAFVIRVNNDTLEPEMFSTWAPKAVALIRGLPETLKDRSILVCLQRKSPNETVAKLPLDHFERWATTRRKCLRWASDSTELLKQISPHVPSISNDRAMDNWLPLFAIAECLGAKSLELAGKAFLEIEGNRTEDDSIAMELLRDIQIIFNDSGNTKIFSKELATRLAAKEDRPWQEWRHGKPISQSSIARMLKPFKIQSKTIRIGKKTAKGYALEQFKDAFSRYLPPIQSVTTSQPNNHAVSAENHAVTCDGGVTDGNSHKPAPHNDCDGVTVENTPSQGRGKDGVVEDYSKPKLKEPNEAFVNFFSAQAKPEVPPEPYWIKKAREDKSEPEPEIFEGEDIQEGICSVFLDVQ